MKILASHHVSFSVADLARSRHFYGTVLGLAEIPRLPNVDVGAAAPRVTPLANHVALAIDDYDAAVAHLRAHGLDVVEAGRDRGQCWVGDPDGNVIELIVPAPR